MRPILAVVALLTAAVAVADDGFVARYKAAMAAQTGKDYARMETELRAALKLRPAHPTALYKLAAAQALRGHKDKALATLDELIEMGLVFDPWKDGDFTTLRGDRDFNGVRRAFARNRDPRGQAERAFRLKSSTFIPEGLAFDDDFDHFYVGSIRERRIQRVLADDTELDFIKPNPGLWAPFGMVVDEKRELLWVTTAAVPEMKDAKPEDLGRTAIVAYALKGGAEKHRFELEDKGEHQLGDLVLLRNGTIYATDSRGGLLYKLDPDKGTFKAVTRPGALASPQGVVVSRDGRLLHVADYTQGLYRYEIESGKLERLEVDEEISVYGIDGLARYRDDLIAIQNGIRPHRVVRFGLGDRGRRVRHQRVLLANHEDLDEPTLGVVIGQTFYFIANSQWGRFDEQHQLPPPEKLRRPMILKLTFEGDDLSSGMGGGPPPAAPPAGGVLPCVAPLC